MKIDFFIFKEIENFLFGSGLKKRCYFLLNLTRKFDLDRDLDKINSMNSQQSIKIKHVLPVFNSIYLFYF